MTPAAQGQPPVEYEGHVRWSWNAAQRKTRPEKQTVLNAFNFFKYYWFFTVMTVLKKIHVTTSHRWWLLHRCTAPSYFELYLSLHLACRKYPHSILETNYHRWKDRKISLHFSSVRKNLSHSLSGWIFASSVCSNDTVICFHMNCSVLKFAGIRQHKFPKSLFPLFSDKRAFQTGST